jgi:hypothetical protein
MATVTKDFRVKAGLVVEGSTATVNGHDILTEALVDAKGDLLVASAADTVTRLAAGTNGYVLTANSGATNGIEWAAPAAVGVFDSSISFEGATANDHETTLQVTDPTADRTITLPDATGQVVLRDTTDTLTNKTISLSNNTFSGTTSEFNTALTDANFVTTGDTGTVTSTMIADGTIVDADINASAAIAASKISGTAITAADTATVTNAMLAGSIANNKLENSSVTINTNSLSLGGSLTLDTDDISEGTNKYFSDELAQDAVGNAVGNGLDYDDNSGAISVDPSEFALNAVGAPTGAVSMATYKITGLGTPTDAADAATKGYVDSVAEGLHIHESVVAATTTNVALATALENGDVLDGITLATGNRILVKNQTTQSENGIYVVQASGQPSRAADFDTAAEVDSGDFVFVYSGTANAGTGWVQTNRPATIGTDAIVFTQFSGAGTYIGGAGLTLDGTTFNVGAGTGIQVNADTIENTGVLSITGTANQITASGSTGAITLSGPQDLHSGATPSFSGVTVGSVTLTDALLGTATATASTSATVVDSWSATTYSSAKYIVQMKKAGDIEVIEVLVTVDGSNNVYLTEYADVISNAQLGTTDADYSGGNVRLLVTAAAADTVVKVSKTYIEA